MNLQVSHCRCRCPSCGLFFNSIAGFDKHRIPDELFDGRRCRSESEMLAAGMGTNTAGYWVTALSEGGFWKSGTADYLDDLI
jgi:hypothetical protein